MLNAHLLFDIFCQIDIYTWVSTDESTGPFPHSKGAKAGVEMEQCGAKLFRLASGGAGSGPHPACTWATLGTTLTPVPEL